MILLTNDPDFVWTTCYRANACLHYPKAILLF